MERKGETEEGVVLQTICRVVYYMTLRKPRRKSSNSASALSFTSIKPGLDGARLVE